VLLRVRGRLREPLARRYFHSVPVHRVSVYSQPVFVPAPRVAVYPAPSTGPSIVPSDGGTILTGCTRTPTAGKARRDMLAPISLGSPAKHQR
jgi:hypothetical protein